MKLIPLTRGYSAIVDDADYEWLSRWNWYADVRPHTVYVARNARKRSGGKKVRMQRQILGAKPKELTDHINGNGLDNRRSNLRVCSHVQSVRNRRLPKNNTSGYLGVSFDKRSGRWRATIIIESSKYLALGTFCDPLEAARTYDKAAIRYHGEFATTNGLIKPDADTRIV